MPHRGSIFCSLSFFWSHSTVAVSLFVCILYSCDAICWCFHMCKSDLPVSCQHFLHIKPKKRKKKVESSSHNISIGLLIKLPKKNYFKAVGLAYTGNQTISGRFLLALCVVASSSLSSSIWLAFVRCVVSPRLFRIFRLFYHFETNVEWLSACSMLIRFWFDLLNEREKETEGRYHKNRYTSYA